MKSTAYIIVPAKDGRAAKYVGGPAGHSIPVGWKLDEKGDDTPPKYIRDN